MNKLVLKSILTVVFFLPVFFYLGNLKPSVSAPSTNVKDQLSSAQLSYFARLGTGNTAGSNSIKINTVGTTLSTTTSNLFVGDTLSVALSAGTTSLYLVKDIGDTATIFISDLGGTGSLGAGSTTTGLFVISPHSAIHTISFTPQSNAIGGKWQVLVKSAGTSQADNLPDGDGFDFGTLAAGSVTCPWSATASVGTTVVISGSSYHSIICSLGAGSTNPIGASANIVIGAGNSMLVNPAATSGHSVGTGDIYTFYVRHLDSSSNLITSDTSQGKIALVESVRVTAVVDPTLTFSIGNSGVLSSGTTLCGSPIGSGAPQTTASTINFSSLSLSTFNNLAHFIQCSTNAPNGYIIQTFEDKPLATIDSGITIPDTTCPSNSCTTDTAASWTTSADSGFGYSLEVGSTSIGFGSPGTATLGFTSGTYKPFGIGFANAKTILSRTNTPSATDSIYICYRAVASNGQPAGTYQNEISYIATATF